MPKTIFRSVRLRTGQSPQAVVMPKLILVKHSLPAIDPSLPARQWRLSDDGRRRCAGLADALRAHLPAVLFSSEEPKAEETARLLAEAWGQGCRVVPGLHEHRREKAGWLDGPAFEEAVKGFFNSPEQLVFGEETAIQAKLRFGGALAKILAENAGQNVVVVAHGTVIALYAAAVAGVNGYALWRRLGLPSFVVFEQPGGQIVTVVERLEVPDGT